MGQKAVPEGIKKARGGPLAAIVAYKGAHKGAQKGLICGLKRSS